MKPLGPEDKKVVRGVTLRADPARDGRFTVANHYVEMFSSPGWSAIERREKLHRDINSELQSLEIAAQTLIDFPEVTWELRLHLARQCWDEVRHAGMFRERLEATGGHIGEFPVMNQEWGIVGMLDSLAARLTIQNRAFEGGSLDVFRQVADHWREAGDERTAQVMEAVLNDEIGHVRFANEWLKAAVKTDKRVLFAIARAMTYLENAGDGLRPRPGDVSINGVDLAAVPHRIRASVADRKAADFSESEIVGVLERGKKSGEWTA